MKSDRKTVIITGAATGIGKAAAMLFAKKGWNTVISFNRSEESAKKLLKELKDFSVSIFRADVSDKQETDALAAFTLEKYGRIDALVNNAGISPPSGLFSDTKKEDWLSAFDINLFGCFNTVQSVLPAMIHEKSGSIVNISSIWGITGASCEVLYSASKAAVIGFTKALSKELAPSFIRVNAVAPGVIDTKMNDFLSEAEKEALSEEIPLGRWGRPEELAECIYFLAGESSSYITGQVITADGGMIG